MPRSRTTGASDLEAPLEDLQRDQLIRDLAAALAALDQSPTRPALSARDLRAVGRARELLDGRYRTPVGGAELEAATGVSRYRLAREFRAVLGTTPYRYLVLRRLERARALIRNGVTLADAAYASGFADQSHMTRHFKRAYGLSPGRWAALAASCRGAAAVGAKPGRPRIALDRGPRNS